MSFGSIGFLQSFENHCETHLNIDHLIIIAEVLQDINGIVCMCWLYKNLNKIK